METTVATTSKKTDDVCDICWKRDKKMGLSMIRCLKCDLRVHQECYSFVGKPETFVCWACRAVGTTVKARKERGKRKTFEITERPSECCLCSVDDGDDWIHAMHPLFDDYGKRGRQIILPAQDGKPERPAWVHTLCATALSVRHNSKGYLYGCARDGSYGMDDEDEDEDRMVENDGSINSALVETDEEDEDENEDGSLSVHHFVMMLSRWYGPKNPAVRRRTEAQTELKCIDCGKDNYPYKIPSQCDANDEHEFEGFKNCHKNMKSNEDCYAAFHVGCAFYGRNEHGEYPEVRRIFFFPGSQEREEVVAPAYCSLHAEDLLNVDGSGAGVVKYPATNNSKSRIANKCTTCTNVTQKLVQGGGNRQQSSGNLQKPPPKSTVTSAPRRTLNTSASGVARSAAAVRRQSASRNQTNLISNKAPPSKPPPSIVPPAGSRRGSRVLDEPLLTQVATAVQAASKPKSPKKSELRNKIFKELLKEGHAKKDWNVMKKRMARASGLPERQFERSWNQARTDAYKQVEKLEERKKKGQNKTSEDPVDSLEKTSEIYIANEMKIALLNALRKLPEAKRKDEDVIGEAAFEVRNELRGRDWTDITDDDTRGERFKIMWKLARDSVGKELNIHISAKKKRDPPENAVINNMQSMDSLPPTEDNVPTEQQKTQAASSKHLSGKESRAMEANHDPDSAYVTASSQNSGQQAADPIDMDIETPVDWSFDDTQELEIPELQSIDSALPGDPRPRSNSISVATRPLEPYYTRILLGMREAIKSRHRPLQSVLKEQRTLWQNQLDDLPKRHFDCIWSVVEKQGIREWRALNASRELMWDFLVPGESFDHAKRDEWWGDVDEIHLV